MSKKYKDYIYVISAVAAAVITAVMAVFNPFYALDSYVTDKLYTKLSGTSQDIIIIGIDEETLAEYGKFELWSRERSADLIEYLYSDVENAPAVTAMDIMYISESGQPADDALAGALDYEAVAAAWDMKAGSKELGERLYREYGKTVGFGVGVNCGVAVVGNIGCDFRMDYTAIGDTVNTAARLEANAKTEQILISEDVYEKIKDRIEATPIGEIPLKGKSNKIMVYSVDSIESTGAAETVNETPAAAAGTDDTGGTNEG